jgi:hypothetical protein
MPEFVWWVVGSAVAGSLLGFVAGYQWARRHPVAYTPLLDVAGAPTGLKETGYQVFLDDEELYAGPHASEARRVRREARQQGLPAVLHDHGRWRG